MPLKPCQKCGYRRIRTIDAIRAEMGRVPADAEAFAAAQPARLVPNREAQLDFEIGYLRSAYSRLIDELLGVCRACSVEAWLASERGQPTTPSPRRELTVVREPLPTYLEVA